MEVGAERVKARREALRVRNELVRHGVARLGHDAVVEVHGVVARGEQARGLEQAVGSMHRIDQLTQSNTAAATETAKAARQLDTDAGELRHELSQLVDTQKRTTEANPQAAPHARTAAVPLAA